MDKKDLQKLRKNIPPKAKEILAEKFQVSAGHIAQILLGNRKNELVIIEASKMAAEHLAELRKAEELIQSF